jgi:hypothetical protein
MIVSGRNQVSRSLLKTAGINKSGIALNGAVVREDIRWFAG